MHVTQPQDLWVLGQRVRVVTVTDGYSLVDITAPPGIPGPPLHLHTACSELFYVLEGELEVITEGSRQRLVAGQSATVAANVLHTFHNPTDAAVRMISVYSPAGFERFFTDMGVPAGTPDGQAASVDGKIIGRVIADAASYGMRIPPPPAA